MKHEITPMSQDSSSLSAIKHPRIESIDLLRGMVMVIMALDHTRDFFTNTGGLSLDLSEAGPALFFTRWITHFCAPVFIFLAGTAAFLSASRGKTRTELSRFLLTRGLFLVFLELTFIRFVWYFNYDYHFLFGQVIWAIGWSMIVLSGLVFFPKWGIMIFSFLLITGHNLFDGVQAENLGSLSWLWMILHEQGKLESVARFDLWSSYPLIPWIGVMPAGYLFGELMLIEKIKRRKILLSLGTGITLLFILIRATNLYGDPHPWSINENILRTVFSFINCEKYPPSLLYLLMTLGPAIVVLSLLDYKIPAIGRQFIVFGKIPLFYYVLHLPFIHALAVVFSYFQYGNASWLFQNYLFMNMPEDYGYSLPVVYLIWLFVIITLYPLCRWYAGYKRHHRYWWLTYI